MKNLRMVGIKFCHSLIKRIPVLGTRFLGGGKTGPCRVFVKFK